MKQLRHCLTLIVILTLFFHAGDRPVFAQAEAVPPGTATGPTNDAAFAPSAQVTPSPVFQTGAIPQPPGYPPDGSVPQPPGYLPDPQMGRNQWHHRQDPPVFFADKVIEKGRTNFGDIVVIKGSTTIDGDQNGDAVVISGPARVGGRVRGDLVVIDGATELGPEARIDGDVVVIGGRLQRAPGAVIGGDQVVIDPDNVPGMGPAVLWIKQGLLMGRPLPFGVGWAWIIAGCFLLFNLLVQLLFPRPIQACVDTVERQPIGSFFTGILAPLLIGLMALLLLFTVVGIILIPFLLAAMLVAAVFGKITIYRCVGHQLGVQARLGFLQSPAVALIAGTAIFYFLYAVPFLGFVAWGFIGIFGFGAVVMATLQKFREEREKRAPAPIPVPAAPLAPTPDQPSSFASGATTMPGEPGMSTPVLAEALLPRAGFWLRLVALALDVLLFLIVLMILDHHPMGGAGILVPAAWLAYHVVLWTWKGTTVGGIVMGLKVIRVNGQPMDFAVALVRALASVFSGFVLGLGFFWAGFSREKQSWHDKIAGTVIVKVPKGMSLI